ncbi:pre-mrna-splicing factor cwc26 [Ophiostoma piceae UAMH 11346]|uniref:Pre-mrna-splicing factor cwc26 n=1 Tax=Ophiostoma piceae (strain UAMH 11346) TaxID=1262450 RepID=S3CCW6_OPHP1|nr:pre-mrna-splicing factor cwc26 [Ophiostoma piceae UAMH 11346]
MPDDLTAYLASRYLTADTTAPKKRKRKHNNTSGGDGLLITDDDDWASKGKGGGDGDDDGDIAMGGSGFGSGATVAGTSSEFRKAKKSNWTSLGGSGNAESSNQNKLDTSEADAIISAAAAEAKAEQDAEDNAPVIDAAGKTPAALMSDGTHAGLQSAASVTAQLERRRREEREQYERERKEKRERRRQRREQEGDGGGDDDRSEGEEEVVYRDATGRRVDISLRRQEARQAELEAEAKDRAAKEALRGDVQREEARRRREQLAGAALMPLARGADDEDMNRELKEQARWNDPMAEFMAKKQQTSAGGNTKASIKAKSSRPVYRGSAAPNRYGIRPGYRWDGVDRSIGFEAERYKAANRRKRVENLEYEWQMDE